MAGLGRTARKAINDYIFKNTTLAGGVTAGGVIWITLHTADPGVDGQTSNEISGSSYAAKATIATDWTTGALADPHEVSNATVQSFPTATTPGYTATHFGLWNHATLRAVGNFIGANALGASQAVGIGNTLSFPIGTLKHTLAG